MRAYRKLDGFAKQVRKILYYKRKVSVQVHVGEVAFKGSDRKK